MNRLRLCLALVWLIFASFAPAHAAVMHHAACDHMVQGMAQDMTMPHTPSHPTPVHDEGAMPCCSVPVVIIAEPFLPLFHRPAVFVKLRPLPVPQLDGLIPAADPRPPKNTEA